VKTEIPVYDIKNLAEYKDQGILASRFAHYAKAHKHLHTAHKHSFYHLVFFTKGSGSHFIDFRKYPVQEGLIYFMIPGQAHSWNFEEEPDGFIVNFSTDYFNSFLHNSNYLERFSFFMGNTDQQVLIVPEPVREQVAQVFEQILAEGSVKQPFDNDLVRALLLQLFIKVERLVGSRKENTIDSYNHTLFRNFQLLIGKRYKELRLPKEYAKLLYITPNHLNALCKDLIGLSAGELIRAQVILESKRLLINLNLSIADIAEVLKFTDTSYFVKFFKKHEGITPDKFRKHNLLDNGK
jgi:AraC family transcriptional activator of pobA